MGWGVVRRCRYVFSFALFEGCALWTLVSFHLVSKVRMSCVAALRPSQCHSTTSSLETAGGKGWHGNTGHSTYKVPPTTNMPNSRMLAVEGGNGEEMETQIAELNTTSLRIRNTSTTLGHQGKLWDGNGLDIRLDDLLLRHWHFEVVLGRVFFWDGVEGMEAWDGGIEYAIELEYGIEYGIHNRLLHKS